MPRDQPPKTKKQPSPYPVKERRSARQSAKKSKGATTASEPSGSNESTNQGVPPSQPSVVQVRSEVDSASPMAAELLDLKNTVLSLSNMLGNFIHSMANVMLPNAQMAVDSVNTTVNNEVVPQVIQVQPTTTPVSVIPELPGGTQESSMGNQVHVLADDMVQQVPQSVPSADISLKQAVDNHVAALMDSSHHPPGKRFNMVGRLIDRHIPDKLKKDIWDDKFIDLHLLINSTDSDEQSPPVLAPGIAGENARWVDAKVTKKDFAIDTGCQAFCIYMSIYTRKHTTMTPNLLAYYTKVQNLASGGGTIQLL